MKITNASIELNINGVEVEMPASARITAMTVHSDYESGKYLGRYGGVIEIDARAAV